MANFEEHLTQLETVVDRLERGDLSLDESVRLFEDGMKLSASCKTELEQAEGRVQVLVEGKDGNLHPTILTDRRNEQEWHRVEAAVYAIFEAALRFGGTLSGEHGVGTLKRPYLEDALGALSIEMQKRIKQALDPLNILNPGKVFPD